MKSAATDRDAEPMKPEDIFALVDCERSGVVREELRALGVNAASCDMAPADDGSPHHIRGDALEAIRTPHYDGQPWNLVIAHPPCTRLANSGVLRLYRDGKKANGIDPVKWAEMEAGARFFRAFFDLQTALGFALAVENPIQHGHAIKAHGCGGPDQTFQPYEFGDDASKRTALWLRGLPQLALDPSVRFPGRKVTLPSGRTVERWSNQTDSGQNKLTPSPDRGQKRSVTYRGIARAMASQWVRYLTR